MTKPPLVHNVVGQVQRPLLVTELQQHVDSVTGMALCVDDHRTPITGRIFDRYPFTSVTLRGECEVCADEVATSIKITELPRILDGPNGLDSMVIARTHSYYPAVKERANRERMLRRSGI